MIKVSHEMPKALFGVHDLINDYPYVLGHMLRQDDDYREFYTKKLKQPGFNIFDNSAFELGESMDLGELNDLVKELKPAYMILPDKVNDLEATKSLTDEYLGKYFDRDGGVRYIGVLQGQTFSEIIDCWNWYLQGIRVGNNVRMKPNMIAIPFDIIPDCDTHNARFLALNKLFKYVNGEGFNPNTLHLLGCKNPSELALYKYAPEQLQRAIFSVDTSSPIMYGWKEVEYPEDGFGLSQPKPKDKLADNLDMTLDTDDIERIVDNVKKFKSHYLNW